MKDKGKLAETAPPERDTKGLVAQAPARRDGADDGDLGRIAQAIIDGRQEDVCAGRVIGRAALSGTVEKDGTVRRDG